jgi:hypothetical protein
MNDDEHRAFAAAIMAAVAEFLFDISKEVGDEVSASDALDAAGHLVLHMMDEVSFGECAQIGEATLN